MSSLILLICESLFPSVLVIDGVKGSDTPPQDILKDISMLCLGSSGNLMLAKEAGLVIGKILKEKGFSFYVFGSLDVLKYKDPNPLRKISSSPYITAQVLQLFAEGLGDAGIIPVIDARGNVNEEVVISLITRKATFPVMVENEEKYLKLRKLGYITSLVITEKSVLIGKLNSLRWENMNPLDPEDIRKKILKSSVVLLGKGKDVFINDPFHEGGVLIFSDESWLVEEALEVLQGLSNPTGRVPFR